MKYIQKLIMSFFITFHQTYEKTEIVRIRDNLLQICFYGFLDLGTQLKKNLYCYLNDVNLAKIHSCR